MTQPLENNIFTNKRDKINLKYSMQLSSFDWSCGKVIGIMIGIYLIKSSSLWRVKNERFPLIYLWRILPILEIFISVYHIFIHMNIYIHHKSPIHKFFKAREAVWTRSILQQKESLMGIEPRSFCTDFHALTNVLRLPLWLKTCWDGKVASFSYQWSFI